MDDRATAEKEGTREFEQEKKTTKEEGEGERKKERELVGRRRKG